MVNMQNIPSYQSFSLSLTYSAYEKNTFQLQTVDDSNTLINAVYESEKYFEFKLDVEINTGKNVNSQQNRFRLNSNAQNSVAAKNADLDQFGEDGYWGVNKTAERISDFVLKGAGDNLQKLKKGREGVVQGLKEAEKIMGGELFDINYETIGKALETIDEKIAELGGSSLIDVSV